MYTLYIVSILIQPLFLHRLVADIKQRGLNYHLNQNKQTWVQKINCHMVDSDTSFIKIYVASLISLYIFNSTWTKIEVHYKVHVH